MSEAKPLNVLFLCTHNSARSILAEALLNHLSIKEGKRRFVAHSAGNSPRANQQPNPYALAALQSVDIATDGLYSKSWDVFAQPDAPHMDLVITVCDNAAGEACPFWPGQPATAHWGYADPSTVQGNEQVKQAAFMQTMLQIRRRLELFMNLPLASIDKLALQNQARGLAQA